MVGSALKVGDRVRLIAETLAWRAEIALQGQIGEIIERREDGRITIRFDNGRLLMAREPESFELVSRLGLRGEGEMSAPTPPWTPEEEGLLFATLVRQYPDAVARPPVPIKYGR